MSQTISAAEITKKSRSGIVALSVRSLLVHVFQTVSLLVLSKFLTPKDYGLFGIVNGWIGVSFFFSDVGISGAVIRQKGEPTESQVASCLSIQLIISIIFFTLFWFIAPWITSSTSSPPESMAMLRILALSLPLYALRTPGKIFFDRNLKFKQQAQIDVSESLAMYLVQITLAVAGFGAWSFIAANVTRSALGTVLMRIYSGQKFKLGLVVAEVRKLIGFGLAFQANAALPALRGLILPLVLGTTLPMGDLGIITWTVGLASIPMALAYNYNHVTFPSFSKLQSQVDSFRLVASRGLEQAILIFGAIFGLAASCGFVLITLLFDHKWSAAAPLFAIAVLATGLSTIRYLFASLMNASGRPGRRLVLEMTTVIAEFVVIFAVVRSSGGASGYFWATAAINALALAATALTVKHYIRGETILRFFAIVAAAVAPYFILQATGLYRYLFASITIYILCFSGVIYVFDKEAIPDLRRLIRDVADMARRSRA